ncbi:ATP-binding protein [Thiolapillus sp.]|uniref:ATP-binding protein n=14 Tax=Thiolapillus sp. TaxID=2017437 RepID=UPI003AF82F42
MSNAITAGDTYVIGQSLFGSAARPKRKMLWNPDELNNGHVLVWGGSGAGKSVFLRDIIGYLRDRKKHVHVLDLHGDLHVEGENSMQFGTWDAPYGVNPFEFLRQYNAGPEQQTHEIVEMFRKTYMRSMGPLQEAVLRRLILDTYKLKGIMPRDMNTWGDKPGENLPVMEDMLYLIHNILEHGEGVDEEVEVGKQVMKLGEKLGKLNKEYLAMLAEQERMVDECANEEALQNKAAQLDKHKRKIDKARLDLQQRIEQYIEERFVLAVPQEPRNDNLAIDYKFYLERQAKSVVVKLRTYVDTLVNQGVFSATPPPVRAGLNRYDLSKMLPKAQIFFCDVLIGKVFRALQMRGEYMKLNDTGRGKRLDTYIVIDEAQKILPDKQADRDRPNLLINRIMSEARKYGLGLIVVTQSPSNFSHIMLANASQKIGFNTNANDIPAAKRLLGIQQDHLFEHAKRYGVAIVSDKQGYLSAQTRVPELIGIKMDDDGPAIGSAAEDEEIIPPPTPDDHAFGGPPELTVIEVQNQSRPAPQPAVAPRF